MTEPAIATDAEVEALMLGDCPVGLFTSEHGTLCLKTEYGNNEGRIDAYIVESGEFFWGGTNNAAEQRKVMVTPYSLTACRQDTAKLIAEAVAAERVKVAGLSRAHEALREAEAAFETIRVILVNELDEPGRLAFWRAVEARNALRALLGFVEERQGDDERCTGCYGTGWDTNAERFCHCDNGVKAISTRTTGGSDHGE